jgi:predicted Zn-dependent protease
MDNLDRFLNPVFGFLDLGMNREALAELDKLPTKFRADSEVIGIRVNIHQALGEWREARMLAESMARRFPEEPHWWVLWSDSQRKETSLADARAVLDEAVRKLPDSAMIQYSLACYACADGDVVAAKAALRRACAKDSSFRQYAVVEPDLERIMGEDFL